jgi:hypothetical protein
MVQIKQQAVSGANKLQLLVTISVNFYSVDCYVNEQISWLYIISQLLCHPIVIVFNHLNCTFRLKPLIPFIVVLHLIALTVLKLPENLAFHGRVSRRDV